MLRGSINHFSFTVSDLEAAMQFFGPVLAFLGYTVGAIGEYSGSRLTINVNDANGIAVNVWEAKPGLADHPFEVYEPGLHHVAFNADSANQVDQLRDLVESLGGEILDGPGEFPFADGGYYAVYFLGPDRIKIECVYMPELEPLYRVRTDSAA